LKSIKCTFARNYTEALDTLYTYKTADEVKPDQIVWVMTSDGYKKVRIIHIDAVYDKAAEDKYGELGEAFVIKPPEEVKQPELPLRSRL